MEDSLERYFATGVRLGGDPRHHQQSGDLRKSATAKSSSSTTTTTRITSNKFSFPGSKVLLPFSKPLIFHENETAAADDEDAAAEGATGLPVAPTSGGFSFSCGEDDFNGLED